MSALNDYLISQQEMQYWQIYTADMMWSCVKMLNNKYPVQPYSQIFKHFSFKGNVKEDNRTGKEIYDDIVGQLRKIGEGGDGKCLNQ